MAEREPAILTIFGITGDLAKRKLLPALYHLAHDKLLPEAFRVVGVTRRGTTVDDVLTAMRTTVEASGDKCEQATMDWLQSVISMVDIDITKPDEYDHLKQELDRLEGDVGVCLNRLFYLAIPSTLFGTVATRLGQHDLNHGCQHGNATSRLLIEKPFGYDLVSAQELISELQLSFGEEQIYRIDHYLAKETVQNILKFRFENPLFSASWDGTHISHILITAAESIGIEGRVAFYEQVGALRDLIQSHLLQILALITMDRPRTMTSQDIHQAKEEILRSIQPPAADEMANYTVRGQYDTYLGEVGKHASETETYAAIRLKIDRAAWKDVPVLIRTGKALHEKVTEVTVVFRDPQDNERANFLTIRIQPNEGIVLDLRIKKPGFDDDIEHTQMDFCYNEELNAVHPDAYERVLVDTLKGDKTLFATSEEILESWRITEPILHAWQQGSPALDTYKTGSWGPDASEKMATDAGQPWLTDTLKICSYHPMKGKNT